MQNDPRQLLLFDAPIVPSITKRARVPPHKFFFGVRPPDVMAGAIAQLGTALASQYGGAPLKADTLHVSLNGVGRYTIAQPGIVDQAVAIAASVTAAPFDVVFDRFLTWGRGGNRPTVLRCTTGEVELNALYEAIYAAMTQNGLACVEAPGTPHLTLFYGSAVLPEQRVTEPFAWRVDRFYLIHSVHGTGRHELKGEWVLNGASTDPPTPSGMLF